MDIERKIDELQGLVSKYDTESFAGFFAYFIKNRPSPVARIDLNKFDSKLKDFLYLISLNAFSDKVGTNKLRISTNELGIMADKLNEIKRFNYPNNFTDYTKESAIHEMALRNHFDNGVLSYIEQDFEKIRKIFTPFEHKIVRDFGLDINFLIEVCKEIELESIVRAKYTMGFLQTAEYLEYMERIQSGKMSPDNAFDLLPKAIRDAFLAFDFKTYSHLMFRREDLYHRLEAEKVDKFLLLFSREAIPDASIRYYTSESPFEATPLLKFQDGNYLSLYSRQLPISIYRLLYTHLNNDQNYSDKLRERRGKYLENKVKDVFQYFFSNQGAFFYTKYYVVEGSEQDLLILFKGTAVIVEAKAAKLGEPFRNIEKAIKRLKRDFKKIVQDGFDQCERVEDFFFGDNSFDIKDKQGRVLYTVNPKKIRNVYSIVVSLDRFGSLQTDLSLMLQKKDNVDYPWSVYIDDLEIFLSALKRNIRNPVNHFLNFLQLRREMHGHIYVVDELDICATYLRSPPGFKEYAEVTDKLFRFSPYEQNYFDDLYWTNGLRFDEKPLPDDYYKYGLS